MKTDALLCTVSSTGFTSLATKRSPIIKVPTNEVHNGMSVFFYAGSTAPCEGNAGQLPVAKQRMCYSVPFGGVMAGDL